MQNIETLLSISQRSEPFAVAAAIRLVNKQGKLLDPLTGDFISKFSSVQPRPPHDGIVLCGIANLTVNCKAAKWSEEVESNCNAPGKHFKDLYANQLLLVGNYNGACFEGRDFRDLILKFGSFPQMDPSRTKAPSLNLSMLTTAIAGLRLPRRVRSRVTLDWIARDAGVIDIPDYCLLPVGLAQVVVDYWDSVQSCAWLARRLSQKSQISHSSRLVDRLWHRIMLGAVRSREFRRGRGSRSNACFSLDGASQSATCPASRD